MSRRYVGQSSLIESNKTGGGQVSGYQVGDIIPGVLESLQESPAASSISTLYYEEALGAFQQPSFQKSHGTRNERIQNVEQWGDSGLFTVDNDIFWNGPACVNIQVDIPYRWNGPRVTPAYLTKDSLVQPQFFYSWGAGYAAVKQWRMNMGGAATYTLDRYANWIGIMASCMTMGQRAGLMKLSGGGVITCSLDSVDTLLGISGSTGEWGTTTNYSINGFKCGPNSGVPSTVNLPEKIPCLVRDNWLVCLKTPHTNFNNPKVRRRPLDTKLFSEHFTVDFWLAQFDEICDSGTGAGPV